MATRGEDALNGLLCRTQGARVCSVALVWGNGTGHALALDGKAHDRGHTWAWGDVGVCNKGHVSALDGKGHAWARGDAEVHNMGRVLACGKGHGLVLNGAQHMDHAWACNVHDHGGGILINDAQSALALPAGPLAGDKAHDELQARDGEFLEDGRAHDVFLVHGGVPPEDGRAQLL